MRVLTTLLLLCFCTAAWPAGVYKWVDENGKVHYGTVRPKQTKAEQIQKGICDSADTRETCAEKKEAAAARRAATAEDTQQRIDALQRHNEVSDAMKGGRAVPGMSPEQVYNTLGKPDRTAKYRTEDGVLLEEWSYDRGPVPMRVDFHNGKVSYVGQSPAETWRQPPIGTAGRNNTKEDRVETRNERIERESKRGDIIDRHYQDNPPQYRDRQ